MADIEKTIEIIFGATDKTGNVIKGLGDGISNFTDHAQKITNPLADITTSILKTEAAIGAVGIAAGAFAYGQAINFESAMLDLEKVMGEGEGSAFDYQERIKDLGLKFGVMSTEVVTSAVNFKQAGFSIEESLSLVEQSLIAVKTADLDADRASQLLVATLKGFGAEASEASRVLDVWNSVSNRFATSAGELATGMAELSPIANVVGLSFEETAGLLTPVIEVFGSGSEAANALKTGLAKLADPTKQTQESLAALGVSTKDAEGNLISVADILQTLGRDWNTLTDEQKFNTAATIFGAAQAGRLSTVLGSYNQVLSVTKVAQEGAGASLAELQVRLGASELQVERLIVAFSNAAITIGTEFKNEATGVISSAANLAQEFDKLVASGGLEPLFQVLRPLLKEFSNNIDKISDNLPEAFNRVNFQGVVDALGEIGLAFDRLFDGLDLTTTEGLTEALQFFIDTGETMIRVTAGIIDGLEPFIDLLVDFVQETNEAGTASKDFVGEILGFATGLNSVLGILDTFGGAIGAVGTAFLSLRSLQIGVELIPQFTAMGNALVALAGSVSAFLVPFAKLSAAFASGFGIGELINKFTTIDDFLVHMTRKFFDFDEAGREATRTIRFTAEEIENLKNKQIEAAESADELRKKENEAKIAISELNAESERQALAMANAAKGIEGLGLVWDPVQKALVRFTDEFDNTSKIYGKGIADLTNANEKAAGTFSVISNEASDASKSLEDVASQSDELKEKMLELASEERIKTIEFAVDFKIAQVEADAQKVISAFESITATIESTNDLLGTLTTSDAPDWDRFGFNMRNQIQEATKRVTEAHESQQKLIEAQIDYINAQTRSMNRGDALIKIEADGMEPELEAFMWKILDKLRLTMAQNYSDFLLGNTCGGS